MDSFRFGKGPRREYYPSNNNYIDQQTDKDFRGRLAGPSGEGVIDPYGNAPSSLRQVEGLLTGQGADFNNRTNPMNFGPGESFTVGPNGVSLEGQNLGVNLDAQGTIGLDYTGDNFKAGLRGRIPRNGVGGSIEGRLAIGESRAPYGEGVGDAISPVDKALGITPVQETTGPSAAQQFLREQMEKYKGIGGTALMEI